MDEVMASILGVEVEDLEHERNSHGDGDYFAAWDAAEDSRAVREYREFCELNGLAA